MEIFSSIQVVVQVVVVVLLFFGASIFVHEWGHYFVALKRGLKVEEFAIGFGPKAFGWRKNGIEYTWRWIPAGGFVKLPQMITSEALEGDAAQPSEPLPPVKPIDKILVAVAGPVMNILFSFVIACVIYFTGLPELVNPPVIGHVDKESEVYQMGIREGMVIVAIDGHPVRTWQEVTEETVLARTNVFEVSLALDGVTNAYSLTAQVNEDFGLKTLPLNPQDHPAAMEVQGDSAAEKAGLKNKDEILSFAGIPIYSKPQLIELIQKRPKIESDIVVERAGEVLTLKITPDEVEGKGRIGVLLGSNAKNVYILRKPGPSPVSQVQEVIEKTFKTIGALVHSKETGVGASDLSGPVGILGILAAHVNTDFRLALSFLVLLNINLAILNLLPIPVLDGGHIVMSLYEWITGRPIHIRVVEYATTAFAILLISFMLYVSFHDVLRIQYFKSMFQTESTIEEAQPAAP